MNVLQMFSYPFMQRALAAGVLVSLCAALLGVPLVLKRYSMIGDGLSHVSFGALAIAVALGVTPLYFSIPVVILAAFFLLRMASHPHWNSDAAIAAVSASALAIGILVISRTTGMTTDEAADAAIAAVKQLSADVNIPTVCQAMKAEEIDQLATDAMNDACFPGNPREATHEDVVELFKKICPEA